MEYYYLMFNTTNLNKKENSSLLIKRIKKSLINAISMIFPNSYTDYDDVINFAQRWLVEFEQNSEHPNREIGIDQNNKVIIKSPWSGRYAYWADINLKLTDYKRQFNAIEVNRQEFELLWNSCITK